MINNGKLSNSSRQQDITKALLLGLVLLSPLSLQFKPLAIPLGPFYLTLVEGAILLLIFLWPFHRLGQREKGVRHTQFGGYVLLFMIFFSLHLLFGIVSHGVILALGDFRQYLPVFLFFPMVDYFNTTEKVRQLRKVVLGIILIVAFYSIVMFVFFNDFLAGMAVKQGMRVLGERIYMVNSLSILFSYLGYVIARLFQPGVKTGHRLVFILIIALNGFMVTIMQSRSLWVMFAVIMLLSFFSMKSMASKIKYVIGGAYFLLLLLSMAYLSVTVFDYTPRVVKRVQTTVVDRVVSFTELSRVGKQHAQKTTSLDTLETRLQTAKRVATDHVMPNFILGSGFGSKIPMVDSRGNIFAWKFQIDNAYLTVLAKFGVTGFLLYLLFTIKIARTLFQVIFAPGVPDEDVMLAKSFLYMILVLTMGAFTSSIFIRQQPLIVGFLIMLCETELMAAKYKITG